MDELSLRLKIADREYPMKVKSVEEEKVRKAAKMVNEKLKVFRNQFGIDDKQDLLAMVAFDCMIKFIKEHDQHSDDGELQELLDNINQKLSEHL